MALQLPGALHARAHLARQKELECSRNVRLTPKLAICPEFRAFAAERSDLRGDQLDLSGKIAVNGSHRGICERGMAIWGLMERIFGTQIVSMRLNERISAPEIVLMSLIETISVTEVTLMSHSKMISVAEVTLMSLDKMISAPQMVPMSWRSSVQSGGGGGER